MTHKIFLIGLFSSFGLAWMCMIAIPVATMAARTPVKMSAEEDAPYYQHNVSGRLLNGAEIYNANGCYTCHSQLIRPAYAGGEIMSKEPVAGQFHENQGGDDTIADIDTRRETSFNDFDGQHYASIGLMRLGPDLSNLGYRAEAYAAKVNLTPEQWIFEHLYNPRNNKIRIGKDGKPVDMSWSICPAQGQMFDEVPANGQDGVFVVHGASDDGQITQPNETARILASYLLSLKRDDALPASLSHVATDDEE